MRQAILLVATFLALASQPHAVTAAVGESFCDAFKCQHNSKCKSGDADFSPFTAAAAAASFDGYAILSETSRDGQHCKCNEGHTGLQCDHKYDICDSAGDVTADNVCFHGGTCHKHQNKDGYRCDCTTATYMGEKAYVAGDNCEVMASTMCIATDDGLETDTWFCANGGTCRDNASDINLKCDCPSGFKGEHCQFAKGKSQPACDLSCKHGGQCAFGSKDHKAVHVEDELYFTEKKDVNGMHCVCPGGYAGVKCEVKLDKCGKDKFCYHGATCLTETDDFGGSSHHCDCSTATDTEVSGIGYAGRLCEHEATALCDSPDAGSPPSLCANGGTCHTLSHMGCDCPSGFTGPFCEYKEGDEPKCKLSCKHGGQCRKGISNQNAALKLGSAFDLAIRGEGHVNFEHCSCPEGYYGIDCSIKIKKCGGDEDDHVCANGAQCVANGTDKDGKIEWGCDCMGEAVAGQHCQHDATQLCVTSGNPDDGGHSFCTNGGTCVEVIKNKEERDHVACDCPAGFTGRKCQYAAGETVVAKEVSTPKHEQSASASGGMGSGAKFAVAALCIAFVGVAFLVVRRRMSGKEELPASVEGSKEVEGSSVTTEEIASNEESAGAGESMTTVEII